jgi:hypothetical protein
MPKVVVVYDPKRKPPEWNLLLTEAEVAVFIEHAASEVPVTGAAGQPTCEIFEDLASAEIRCREIVARDPHLRCLVFDHRGRGLDPIALFESPVVQRRELGKAFRRWSTAVMLSTATVLIWLDWRSDFERMWPSILAWKLVTTALIFITWELALLTEKYIRSRRQLHP